MHCLGGVPDVQGPTELFNNVQKLGGKNAARAVGLVRVSFSN